MPWKKDSFSTSNTITVVLSGLLRFPLDKIKKFTLIFTLHPATFDAFDVDDGRCTQSIDINSYFGYFKAKWINGVDMSASWMILALKMK